MRRSAGFTLIEMIVVIVVLGVVATSFGLFILPAINAHQAVARRAELVDSAESALRLISRDVRIALPNSVRVTTFVPSVGHTAFAIELIPTADGGRYCTPDTADCNSADVLTIGANDGVFDVLGLFRNAAFASLAVSSDWRLAVNNSDFGVYTATASPGVLTAATNTTAVTTAVAGHHRVTLGANHFFPTGSPRQRVFVIRKTEAPVSYVCDSSAGTLLRYAGYTDGAGALSTASQPTNPAAPPLNATSRQVAGKVSACDAKSEANAERRAVLTVTIALSDTGETVQLLKQVHLDNSQ